MVRGLPRLRTNNYGGGKVKVTKHTLDHIELITTGDTALFEINMVVAMHD